MAWQDCSARGAADDAVKSTARKLAKNSTAQAAVTKLANGLGEGFEEFLSEFSTRVANELMIDTDDRTAKQTLNDAWRSFVMDAAVSGVIQTAGSVVRTAKTDPKALARTAADTTLTKIKGQSGNTKPPTMAEQINSMQKQLADMQFQKQVDDLAAVYEKNVGPIEADTKLDEPAAVGYDKLNKGLEGRLSEGEKAKPDSVKLVVRDSKFEDFDGNVDWETWAPNGGRVPETVQEGQTLKVGTIIDRYGEPYGRYTSPIGVPYEQRALPYIEDSNAYHQYEVIQPIDNVTISKIAQAFEQPGGGLQYELPLAVDQLIKTGYLKEITK